MSFSKASWLTILIPLAISACQRAPRSLLYPTTQQQQIDYLCRVVYEREFRRNAGWEESAPEFFFISEERVTYHFTTGQSTTIVRHPELIVPPGTYPCP
ncbi:MAG: hypothetical protein CL913_11035 [Deltaproteobacteria bacterium]|nr:hypothetical protein [Deltaproteobacteria bacterium]